MLLTDIELTLYVRPCFSMKLYISCLFLICVVQLLYAYTCVCMKRICEAYMHASEFERARVRCGMPVHSAMHDWSHDLICIFQNHHLHNICKRQTTAIKTDIRMLIRECYVYEYAWSTSFFTSCVNLSFVRAVARDTKPEGCSLVLKCTE